MTGIDRFESELPMALSDVAGAGRNDYLIDILGRTAQTRQRPAWASLERWLPMDLATTRAPVARIPWRTLAVLAALVLVAAMLAVYAGSQRRLPAPFGPAANGLIPYSYEGDILLGDPVTGQGHLLVDGPEDDYGPSFSSDGTLIGFLRVVADRTDSIVVADAQGGDVHEISDTPFRELKYAQWVPGQHELLVAHRVGGKQRLEVVDAAGEKPPRLLLEGADVDLALYRPPAADQILVRGRIKGTWGLYTMRPDGTDIRRLAVSEFVARNPGQLPDADLDFPSYSPDGSKIYYNRWSPQAEGIQAWVMNADGSDQHRFNASGPPAGWWEGEMVPSPDGRSVLMWRVPPAGEARITIFPADGSGEGLAIGPTMDGTAHWLWAPDSTKVLMNYNDASEGGQVLIDPVTGDWTDAPWGANTEPDWQRLAP